MEKVGQQLPAPCKRSTLVLAGITGSRMLGEQRALQKVSS